MIRTGASVIRTALFCFCLSGVSGVAVAQVNSAAETEIRFQQLEKEIRRLTGQIEQQQYEIRQLCDKVSGLQNALNNSGKAVTQNGDIYAKPLVEDSEDPEVSGDYDPSQPPPFKNETVQSLGTYTKPAGNSDVSPVSVPASDFVSTGNMAQDYDNAYSYIKARDFDNAEAAFGMFINKYPDSDLVSNAKYWYGETFYVRGSYDKAARIFAEGYQKYPQSPKAASNLLKLGMSLVGMGKPDDACIAFKQLKKDYSDSAIPVLKRADVEMEKISCQ